MKKMRLRADNLFRGLIKLCTLTGVTFLVTACYGVRPEYTHEEKQEVEELEKKLADSITVDKNDKQR
jgi:hypothetical protein